MARLFLKDSPLVILDEATVFTDAENEARLQEAFARLTAGRTVVVVAHRLSTVIDCDAILVLDRGRLSGMGTHEDLLLSCPLYRSMWEAHLTALDWRLSAGGEAA